MAHIFFRIKITIKTTMTIHPTQISIVPNPSITSLNPIPVDIAKKANNASATARLPLIFISAILNPKAVEYLILVIVFSRTVGLVSITTIRLFQEKIP